MPETQEQLIQRERSDLLQLRDLLQLARDSLLKPGILDVNGAGQAVERCRFIVRRMLDRRPLLIPGAFPESKQFTEDTLGMSNPHDDPV